jgi:hypothetical protein
LAAILGHFALADNAAQACLSFAIPQNSDLHLSFTHRSDYREIFACTAKTLVDAFGDAAGAGHLHFYGGLFALDSNVHHSGSFLTYEALSLLRHGDWGGFAPIELWQGRWIVFRHGHHKTFWFPFWPFGGPMHSHHPVPNSPSEPPSDTGSHDDDPPGDDTDLQDPVAAGGTPSGGTDAFPEEFSGNNGNPEILSNPEPASALIWCLLIALGVCVERRSRRRSLPSGTR